MTFILSILPTLLVLGILIMIHEYGHFLACRLTGVRVEKFSIGFGPEILHWKGKETRYAVSLIPLGGFVKPSGESASEVEASGPKKGDYLAAPLASRILIVAAGVLMNYALAFFLFTAIFMMGRPVPGTTIGGFVPGYPAEKSGLRPGDRIVRVGGRRVTTWPQLTEALQDIPAGETEVLVERKDGAGKISTAPVRLAPHVEKERNIFGEMVEAKRLGITPHPAAREFERDGFLESVHQAWQTEVFMTVMTHKGIFYMMTGRLSLKTLQGPIGIVTMTGTAAKLGLPYLLQLTATLSVSLAVINLFPIPALDGGHLLFLLIEAVRRKRVSLRFQERATQVGFVLLLLLMSVVIYNDLVNIQAFEKLRHLFIKP